MQFDDSARPRKISIGAGTQNVVGIVGCDKTSGNGSSGIVGTNRLDAIENAGSDDLVGSDDHLHTRSNCDDERDAREREAIMAVAADAEAAAMEESDSI